MGVGECLCLPNLDSCTYAVCNLPIVIYRTSTVDSLGRLLECLKCYITYVTCAVVIWLIYLHSPSVSCVHIRHIPPAHVHMYIICNRPQWVFPRGLPKILSAYMAWGYDNICHGLDSYFIDTQKAYDCGFSFIKFYIMHFHGY